MEILICPIYSRVLITMGEIKNTQGPRMGQAPRYLRDEMIERLRLGPSKPVREVPYIDYQMQAANDTVWTVDTSLKIVSEALDNEEALDDNRETGFWHVGLMGGCNIVAFRDDVLQGVGYTPEQGCAEQIVRAHNAVVARFQKALTRERFKGANKST